MRVIANATGFDNLAIREPGEEFDMPDDAEAHWFDPVDKNAFDKRKAAKATAAKAGAEPAAKATKATKTAEPAAEIADEKSADPLV